MRPSELANADWLRSCKGSPTPRGIIKRKSRRRPKDFFGNNEFCSDADSDATTDLTKHHLTRAREKRRLRIWLCSSCRDKRHGIKPKKKKSPYGPGWDEWVR